jgi:hypothetical protein
LVASQMLGLRHREIIIASIPWRLDGSEELSGQRRLDGLEELGGQGRLDGLEELGSQRRLDGLKEQCGQRRLDGLEELGSQRRLDGLEEQGGQRRLDGLEELGSQRRLDGLEELGGRIQVGDWIASPTRDTGNPLDWVYFVLAKDKNTTKVLEFKRTSPNGRIQLTSSQAHTMSTLNMRQVRVLAQENPKAPLKVARDPPAPGKKAPLFWIFDSGIIQDFPWDPGEWHWQPHPPLGDTPFFGYSAKRGYNIIRKSTQKSSMTNFLEELNLRNSSTAQLTARIWHCARPRKVGTLIWLTLNKGLPVGTWLRTMGLPLLCKVCDANSEETPQHCFLECSMAQHAWEAFKRIWSEWQAPHDLDITWPFVLLGEATMEREDDTLGLLAYHAGGFTYPRQPLDILRSLIVYTLWTERCRMHFVSKYSLAAVLTQAWVATVEVGMATWKAIKSQRTNPDPVKQNSMETQFKKEWLHKGIMGSDNATIRWHFLPPLYFLNLINEC